MRFLLITEPARCSSVMVALKAGELPDEALVRYCESTPSLLGVLREWRDESELTSLGEWLRDATGDSVQFVNVTRVIE